MNSATFAETWFELIGTAGRTFSYMHASCVFAEAAGTTLCKGNVEEIADVRLDYAGMNPLAILKIILVFHCEFNTFMFLALHHSANAAIHVLVGGCGFTNTLRYLFPKFLHPI